MIGHSLDGYLNDLQFGIGVSGGGEGILHAVNRMIEDRGDDVSLSMLLMDLKNAFNLVDRKVMLEEVRLCCPDISRWVEFYYSSPAKLYYGEYTLWSCQGAWYLNDVTIVGDTLVVGKVLELIIKDGPRYVLHLNVDKTEILCGPVSVNFDFSSELVLKRVSKTIGLMDAVTKINDPQCELLLLRACTWISKLYFVMRTCPPCVFESAQRSFDVALCSALERITKLLRHVGIVASGPTFDDALCVFNASIDINLLSNPSEIVTPKLMKKIAGILLFSISKPCLACSRFFAEDVYGEHVVSCAGIIGIKHRHNVVCDALIDICFWSGISVSKEVDKPLRPADVLLYSWHGGLDVCADLTESSPLTQTGMTDFVHGRSVIDATQRKGVKYQAKCADFGYGFLPFLFYSFGELKNDVISLLKRIQKFSLAQDIVARAVVHIFSRIKFAIAREVWAQIDHTSDWLRVVPIYGLGQTMNSKTYRGVLCNRLGVPLFSVSKSCSTCSKVFARDIYEDHAISCAGIIGIKHRHNVVRDTLVDIYFRSGISAGKEVDIGLGGGWSLPLTQTGMVDFVPSRAVIDAAHRIWFSPLFFFFAWGIREGCSDSIEADPKVLHDSGH
nr:putative reverse transcriptase domain-containing protein [Tanacetum cinerariifolium]